ncbi:MAG: hypothetical protein DRJ31_00280 [Candidatus Methanomethylicota archaeon]|uniref:Calcineurin-like phosphoesterase domain-containing protein n=1 Tax=Thermoproteota archaeon TaxID=2056631 RepID=A0A497EU32_9CREN|nr:MAG: hypothetical protein DRJ31_00280 [Candidatus Verstraetearchaeota archaeon]RLE52137.1 MAG: hypothetical protein DRJ33_04485 [Candidatus Verstraetearchaeota archaeon]
MQVLALSDIHGEERKFKEVLKREISFVDLVLIAGDITDFGSIDEIKSLLKDIEKPFFYVLGNCDPVEGIDGIKGLERHYIHGRLIEFQGFYIAGLSGSGITPFNTNIELSEDDFAKLIKHIYEKAKSFFGKMILVTHEPPANSKVGLTRRGVFVGSYVLRRFIEEQKPLLVVCGHIHEGRGVEVIGETKVVNPGPVRAGFYALIKVEEGRRVDVELKRL